MDGLTEGRLVHYVMPDGQHRPAMVVKVWNKQDGYINLQVFTDGSNDTMIPDEWENSKPAIASGIWWRTSILPDETDKAIGTWHWIEKA